MTRRPSSPQVVLLSARDTLRALGPMVRARGVRFRRIEAIRPEAFSPGHGAGASMRGALTDTVIVTSRHGVGPALLRWARPGAGSCTPEVWAAGPGTAERLRRLGFARVRRGAGLGAEGIVGRLGPRRRTILHVRSEAAGGSLARSLRARGHRVSEVIAYRVRPVPFEIRRRLPEVRTAAALVVTSPSVIDSLRRAVGRRVVREIGRTTPVVVLGETTARAAAAAGFRHVTVAPSTTPQRFASLLVRTVVHAPA